MMHCTQSQSSRIHRRPVLFARTGHMIVIHLGESVFSEQVHASYEHLGPLRPAYANNLLQICRHIAERSDEPPLLLVPEQYLSWTERLDLDSCRVSLLPYTADSSLELPQVANVSNVVVFNGRVLSVTNYSLALGPARQHQGDVQVSASFNADRDNRYAEFLHANESAGLVRIHHRYDDSPTWAELERGPIAFLRCSVVDAPAVINHVIIHGWGLDSVGLLTRRFRVRWYEAAHLQTEVFCSLGSDAGKVQDSTATMATYFPLNAALHGSRFASKEPEMESHDSLASSEEPARPKVCCGDRLANGAPVESTQMRTPPILKGSEPSRLVPTDAFQLPANDAAPGKANPADMRAYRLAKRLADFVLSAVALVLMSPLFLAVILLIKLTSRGPIFFVHRRQGLGGTEFGCLKFRTMTAGADALQRQLQAKNEVDGPQFKIDNDPRLTKLGAWMRRFNVDELPQLVNVVLGEMSLVGPRPSPDNENQYCPGWRRARLSVTPGITGLWQVLRLRDPAESDFQEWIYYDLEYVRHRSLWLDLQILMHTPLAMFRSTWLSGFVGRLQRRGICLHSPRLCRKGRNSPLQTPEAVRPCSSAFSRTGRGVESKHTQVQEELDAVTSRF